MRSSQPPSLEPRVLDVMYPYSGYRGHKVRLTDVHRAVGDGDMSDGYTCHMCAGIPAK